MGKRVKIYDSVSQLLNQLKKSNDATLTVSNELEAVDKRIFTELQKGLYSAEDIPVNGGQVGAGDTTYSFNYITKFGRAAKIGSGADDLPIMGLSKEKTTYEVTAYGAGYTLNTQEIDSMLQNGTPVKSEKASAVVLAFQQSFNDVAYFGDDETGKTGLLNNALVTQELVAQNAGLTSRLWSAKTMAERLADCVTLWNNLVNNNKMNPMLDPDTLLLASNLMGYCNSPYSDDSSDTLKQKIEKSLPGVTVKFRTELNSYFTGTTNGMVLYKKSPMFVEFLTAKDITAYAEQAKNLSIMVPYEARIVGTVIRYPNALRIAYGI